MTWGNSIFLVGHGMGGSLIVPEQKGLNARAFFGDSGRKGEKG